MKIGVDIDDTIANSYDNFLIYALEYDKKLRNTGLVKNDRSYHYCFDWTKNEIDFFYMKYFLDAFGNVQPKFEAVNILNNLFNLGNDIIFITSRNNMNTSNNAYTITKNWMDKHNICYSKIITQINDKSRVCNEEKIDIFIDDSFSQCVKVSDNTNILVILFDEFNRFSEDCRYKLAKDWNQIYKYILSKK